MKWTKEKEKQLRDLAFAEKSNKEISEIMDISIDQVWAGRSRFGITIAKVKKMKEKEPAPRTKQAIKTEIQKVQRAKRDAQNKVRRCEDRLKELDKELFGEELVEIARS